MNQREEDESKTAEVHPGMLARTHTRIRMHAHTHTHARTHSHTRTQKIARDIALEGKVGLVQQAAPGFDETAVRGALVAVKGDVAKAAERLAREKSEQEPAREEAAHERAQVRTRIRRSSAAVRLCRFGA